MKKISMQLETLACPTCANKIEAALAHQKGVSQAKVLFNASKANVEFDESAITADRLVKIVSDLGYAVLGVKQ